MFPAGFADCLRIRIDQYVLGALPVADGAVSGAVPVLRPRLWGSRDQRVIRRLEETEKLPKIYFALTRVQATSVGSLDVALYR